MDIIQQFQKSYSNDNDCIPLIHKLKWPSGFCCPRCQHRSAYTITTRRLPIYECRSCKHQASLTSGTAMDKSRTPLHKWLLTLFIVAACENGTNAVQLAELIKVTYKTAWTMLKKIRLVISDSDRSILLSGVVEAKLEIYMKQPIPTYEALQKEHGAIIARSTTSTDSPYLKIKLISCEQSPRGFLTKQAEREFLELHVGSDLSHIEINRRHINPPGSQALLPGIAKSAFHWMNDTFHGLGLAYAQSYLDEFCFRYNQAINHNHCPFEFLLQLCLSGTSFRRCSINFRTLHIAS
ncbi:transposase [Paenibacillus alkaliterrae]|uniref:transposase n=1 Tax=Paenibacillus alkaliterrae TaxID=320909 RepID=UPI001F483BE1|nr:transposase [Paenibacillus alkaliterrae]MCF2938374.1 transposase [Paenibacillus alkaliterrae]